jgi:hypothetical protein
MCLSDFLIEDSRGSVPAAFDIIALSIIDIAGETIKDAVTAQEHSKRRSFPRERFWVDTAVVELVEFVAITKSTQSQNVG